MASDREPMTAGGYQALKEELKRLKSVERIEIAKQIEVARAHGDLSENAEYHAAREKQSFIEGRIKELESKLALAEIIDPKTLSGNKVVFGATVKLLDCESEDEIKYQIVSVKAPLARALIGQRVGEIVTIKNPKKGDREYEILSVDFI
jgi:transcription elongation factor GreA